jgi:hypothetical protein
LLLPFCSGPPFCLDTDLLALPRAVHLLLSGASLSPPKSTVPTLSPGCHRPRNFVSGGTGIGTLSSRLQDPVFPFFPQVEPQAQHNGAPWQRPVEMIMREGSHVSRGTSQGVADNFSPIPSKVTSHHRQTSASFSAKWADRYSGADGGYSTCHVGSSFYTHLLPPVLFTCLPGRSHTDDSLSLEGPVRLRAAG